MCGFIIGKNVRLDLSEEVEKIAYRGLPGFKGYLREGAFQLAHYSLPFVDLNPANAIQPYLKSKAPCLFAGEIFNYSDFGAATDISLISDSFHSSGLNSFHKFDGFWSFATIFQDSVLAVVDYLGQKPLYYRTDMQVVASEIDILRGFGACSPDKLFLSNMVKWGYDPTLRTPWKEIKQIPPGCFYHGGRIQEYWDWSKIIPTNLADDLRESVVARLGGQRELSVLLSGGLDSSIIYKLISQVTSKSITAVHVDNGEADFANLICDELVHVSLDDVGDEEAIQIHQTPVDLGSVKPQIAMARKLKELGFNAVITGDGADEIFGGYQRAKEYDSQFSDVFCELPYYHLPRLDRIMMASTIECRSPFLSPKVVAYGLSSPYSMRDGEKKLLKEAFRDILPAEILNRDKKPLKTDSIRKDPLAQRKINLEIWKNLG